MRTFVSGLILSVFFLLACRATVSGPLDTVTPIEPTDTISIPSATVPPPSTNTPIPTQKTETPQPTPTPSPTSTNPGFQVRVHPDGGLFVGDQVSFEVIAPPHLDLQSEVLQISTGEGTTLEAQFAPFGIGGRNQVTIYWGWDTTDEQAGPQNIEFSIQPSGDTWTQTIVLHPESQVPPPEPLAGWAREESDCCIFYYVTETASAREIHSTLIIADELAESATSTLAVDFTEPLVVTLMPRVLGQGGFASNEMYISYLDRNYVGNSLDMVLHHEMVHILDRRLGGELRPTILIEGLAVYLTGGHYKPEDLIPRAAALLHPNQRADGLGLGWYLPLRPLINDFYQAQHEIGYIQAGALVEFMVDTWGWEAYSTFYRDIHPIDGGTQADSMDAALQYHFELSLDELEQNFLNHLKAEPISLDTMNDIQLTVEFFDTMRRYQQILDPSAYFLTAWLPNGPVMRESGIVADLVRRPAEIENLALETMLASANRSLRAVDLAATEEALSAINKVLDNIEHQHAAPFESHPLAKAHFDIASRLHEYGYQVEWVDVNDEIAYAVASQGWANLSDFQFSAETGYWSLVSGQ